MAAGRENAAWYYDQKHSDEKRRVGQRAEKREHSGQLLDHVVVRLRPAVAEELPRAPDLLDHVEVHLRDDELVLVLAALRQEVAARIHEVARAVELADVPRRLDADPIDTAHEVAVGDGVRGLLQLPEIL